MCSLKNGCRWIVIAVINDIMIIVVEIYDSVGPSIQIGYLTK